MLPKITRRSILKFIGLFSFSSLFRPFKTIETLAKDENTARIILAHGSESHGIPFVLHCENPFEAKPPVITYWEYFRDYQGYWNEREEMSDEDFNDYGITKGQLDENCPVDWYEHWWQESYSATAPIYHEFAFLDEKDLGEELYDKIDAFEGVSPGNDYTAIEMNDKETVIEYEKKLNDLGYNIKIEFVDWYI
jgi:hypothetical protein